MFNMFYGSYVIIINNNEAIEYWMMEILKSQKFSQRSSEFRNRIINVSHDFSSNDCFSLSDIPVKNGEFILSDRFFQKESIAGKSKQPKALRIRADYHIEKEIFDVFSQNRRVISHVIFFISGEYSKDVKIMLGYMREILPDAILIAQCDNQKDVDTCLGLGANYAHSIHDSNSYLLFGKLLDSFMIDFITEIIDDVREENNEPLIFDVDFPVPTTTAIPMLSITKLTEELHIEVISLYHVDHKKYHPIPMVGEMVIYEGLSHLICWGYKESDIIEFREKIRKLLPSVSV